MSSEDVEFRQCAELLLRGRLNLHRDTLVEAELSLVEKSASSQLARGHWVNGWSEALERQCERTLSDLLTLMKTFGARSPEWIQRAFAAHVDELAAQVAGKMTEQGASRSGDHRKVTNLASSVKAQAREHVARAFEMASKVRETDAASENRSPEALDGLLPLNQRGVFDRDLPAMIKSATASAPLSLLMVDLDHFKQVNDVHGHQAGDQVLIGVADILVMSLSRKGKAYRYGGEELSVLLPNYSVDESIGFGERVRKSIESAVLGKKGLKVTASLGLAAAPLHAAGADTLLERADAALYEAKHGGRNRLCVAGSR